MQIYILLIFVMISLSSCVGIALTGAVGGAAILSKDQSVGGVVNDTTLATKIKSAFIQEKSLPLYSSINVEVIDGVVILIGNVSSQEMIDKAIQICFSENGTKDVISYLEVLEYSSVFSKSNFYTKDTIITTQIKSLLLTAQNINYMNYNIITQNGVVYIIGTAASQNELERVSDIASRVRGVKKVVSNVVVKEGLDKNGKYKNSGH